MQNTILLSTFEECLLYRLFFTSSRAFSELDTGNAILFQIKKDLKITGTTVTICTW